MKNIVFIPNIKLDDSRSTPYHYSIKSWQKWSEQYDDIEVIEWDEAIMDPNKFKITLQRYWVHDILAYNNVEYNQVLIVDADTIIHPDCPNFFKETQGKFGVTLNNGCYEWVTRSIRDWGNASFPNSPQVKPWKYFNGGFQITSKKHIPFYKGVQEYYTQHIDHINNIGKQIKAGTDQTIINYLVQQNNIDTEYMSEAYNLQDLFRKNLLHIPGHSWFPDELRFLQAGWIYHFNAIPQNDRHVSYWMERTYNELYT
jgi:hypothetical protein|tara:strand:+ start:477 stop:1244 length:768 start_codon:yes stop_codon:yes gene_type:complete